jgi:tripartite-type tricarboxylate transporter receptor subunit TctC
MRDAMRRMAAAVLILTGLLATPSIAQQAAWPSRPVTVIVPFSAGGGADLIARAIAEHLTGTMGQSFVIDNRGGAGGNLGGAAAAKAPADGYTLFFGSTGPAATNTLMYKSLSFDPRRDFTPVVLVGKTPVIIVARPDAPFASMKEMLAYARANPGKLTAAFPGNGTLGHITGVLLNQQAGLDIKHVQYRGGGAIINDLLGGHIDLSMDAMSPYVPLAQEGKIRALAVSTAIRAKQLPDVPTVSEAGLPGFDASVWYCLLAPAGVPDEVIAKLNTGVNAYLKTPAAHELFDRLGAMVGGSSPAELKAFIDGEIDKWGPVVKAAKIEF